MAHNICILGLVCLILFLYQKTVSNINEEVKGIAKFLKRYYKKMKFQSDGEKNEFDEIILRNIPKNNQDDNSSSISLNTSNDNNDNNDDSDNSDCCSDNYNEN
jgi:hypothetical protein